MTDDKIKDLEEEIKFLKELNLNQAKIIKDLKRQLRERQMALSGGF